MTDLDLIVINDKGRRFGIRIVRPGDGYGVDDKVISEYNESMIEFYDYTYASDDTFNSSFGERGQFVSRYFVSTLLERPVGGGLDLMGYEPVWKVDEIVMQQVFQLIASEVMAITTPI